MKEQWLQTGFKHFAENGPMMLSIKGIAKEIGVPRTTFYHYFADKENLIEELLTMYMNNVDRFVDEGKTRCKTLIPDLYILLEKYAVTLQFNRQLLLNRIEPQYNLVFQTSRHKSNTFIVALFIDYYKFNIPYKLAEELWNSLTESWYLRLNPNDITVDSMQKITDEIMQTVLKFVQSKIFMEMM